jgi:hypothetical protein
MSKLAIIFVPNFSGFEAVVLPAIYLMKGGFLHKWEVLECPLSRRY